MREQSSRSPFLVIAPLILWSACASELATDEANLEDRNEVAGQSQALEQPIDTVVLNATADTSIRNGFISANRNYGTESSLSISRGLVIVDQDALATVIEPFGGDYVISAKLRLTVGSSIPFSLPRVLNVHRLLKPWSESGATWNCAIDSNPANTSLDCTGPTRWSSAGGDYDAAASGSAVLPLTIGQTAVVEIDVTEDVRAFKEHVQSNGGFGLPNHGWLLKPLVDLSLDVITLGSRESSTPPQLVLEIRRCNVEVCNDGISCSQDGICGSEGRCIHLIAPPVSPCDDNNACTSHDHCSGMDFSCVAGDPAPVGTPCGSGLECNDQQQCVPSSPE